MLDILPALINIYELNMRHGNAYINVGNFDHGFVE